MTDAARIALAGPADLPALMPVMREFYAGEALPWDEVRLRGTLDALWAEPLHGRVWLARVRDEPVGYGVLCLGFSLEYFGRDAFVDELFVRPAWRRRGIGTALLEAMEQACREEGVAALHLEVDHPNEAGQRLYRRHGFLDHDRYLMTKRLDG